MELNAVDRIRKCRIKLEKENPFFSYIALSLNLKEFAKEQEEAIKQENNQPTMAVDSVGNLYYNSDFVNSLTIKELEVVLLHEVLHLVCFHTLRGKGRKEQSPEIYNIAIDICVNDILRINDYSFGKLEKGSVIPDSDDVFTYGKIRIEKCIEKTAEQLFDEIYKQAKKNNMLQQVNSYSQGKGFDNHIKDKGKNGKSLTEKEKNKLENNLKKKVSEARTKERLQGKETKGIGRTIDEILTPKISWRDLLYRYLSQAIISDYSFRKPSKKSVALGVYLPSTLKENLEITCFIDVSGSIDKSDLKEFISELLGIKNSFENLKINLVFWDTQANNSYVLDNSNFDEITNLKIDGGGGTNFTDCYNYIEKEIPNTKILLFFTDSYASFPEEMKYNTIWILTKDGREENIPFGDVIKLE